MRMGRGYDNSSHVYGGQIHTPTAPFSPGRAADNRGEAWYSAEGFKAAKITRHGAALPFSSKVRWRCPRGKTKRKKKNTLGQVNVAVLGI